jgi:ABC-2 type transport system ATP-binding protein
MSVIVTHQLTKSYGTFQALKDLNLEVKQNEIYGFIGPNGAGKSTTIRILLGLLRNSGGKAEIFGKDVYQNASELHSHLAYVPSDVNLWPYLTGGEVIDLLAKMRGKFDTKRKAELLERFQLDPTKKCKTYSKGNRQKVLLISAFVSDVDLLILDEPTSGLDPLMEMEFQSCIREAKDNGKTVFLSSHILTEVENVCDRIGIIKNGTIVESGTLSEMRHLTQTRFTVETITPVPEKIFSDIRGVFNVDIEGKRVTFSIEGDSINQVLQKLTQYNVVSLNSTPPTLEELFIRHYSE